MSLLGESQDVCSCYQIESRSLSLGLSAYKNRNKRLKKNISLQILPTK